MLLMNKLLSTFPWKCSVELKDLEQSIRENAPIEEALLLGEYISHQDIRVLQTAMQNDPSLFLFLHESEPGTKPHPVFCILKTAPSPSPEKIQLQIGKKIKRLNFLDSVVMKSFVNIIYSEKNRLKLGTYGLALPPRESYYM